MYVIAALAIIIVGGFVALYSLTYDGDVRQDGADYEYHEDLSYAELNSAAFHEAEIQKHLDLMDDSLADMRHSMGRSEKERSLDAVEDQIDEIAWHIDELCRLEAGNETVALYADSMATIADMIQYEVQRGADADVPMMQKHVKELHNRMDDIAREREQEQEQEQEQDGRRCFDRIRDKISGIV